MKIKILLLVIMLAFSFNIALADSVTTNTTITNSAPTIGTITTNSPLNIADTNVTVWCNATVTDNNVHSNVNTVNATFWNPTYATESESNNIYDHYTNSSCSIGTNTSITDIPVSCSFSVDYRALIGTWTCKLNATDASSATGDKSSSLTIYDCGDGSCTSGESCSVCAIDCGDCSYSSSSAYSTSSSTATTSAAQETVKDVLSPALTQPPSEPEAEEGLPEITGEATVSPPEQIIPLNISLIAAIAIAAVFLFLYFWPSKKRRRPTRRKYYGGRWRR